MSTMPGDSVCNCVGVQVFEAAGGDGGNQTAQEHDVLLTSELLVRPQYVFWFGLFLGMRIT